MDNRELLFEASTRGGKYSIEAYWMEDGSYSVYSLTKGQQQGASHGLVGVEATRLRVVKMVLGAKYIDRINYVVKLDRLDAKVWLDDNPHFNNTSPHRYEGGECVYCGRPARF